MPFTGNQEQTGRHERAEQHDAIGDAEFGQADSKRSGKNSENGEDGMCGEKPAKELSKALADDLVKEEQGRKNDYARDNPMEVAPKHSRFVEERPKGRARSQQPDSIETAKQAEVNQCLISRPAAKEEKNQCDESNREKGDGSRNVRELPVELRA